MAAVTNTIELRANAFHFTIMTSLILGRRDDQIRLAFETPRRARSRREITETHAADLSPRNLYHAVEDAVLSQADRVNLYSTNHGATADGQNNRGHRTFR